MLQVKSLVGLGLVALLVSCGGKKYENPISKDTAQPDKVLFDKAMKDVEKNRFEVARLTLNTLMNTYDTSEYMAKAKLLYADSWYREGTSSALTQAEAEYKDFQLFFPQMEESAEAQNRVCDIHYRQMAKSDRDPSHALRAEAECRDMLIKYPNSKFVPEVEQKLRDIQEVVAQTEYGVGNFYHQRQLWASSANRLETVANHYPLFSRTDEALWKLGDSYSQLGPRFRDRAGEALTRIVRDYPLSEYVEPAKKKLKEWEMPIPEADQIAYNRMKYEVENRPTRGLMNKSLRVFSGRPDTIRAARSGKPVMTSLRPGTPISIPGALPTAAGTGEVTASPITDPTALDTKPDARTAKPKPQN
jgi:outer membrane protein assembly factor BamD